VSLVFFCYIVHCIVKCILFVICAEEALKDVNLDKFLARNTSEDNVSFSEIMADTEKKQRLKHAWLYEKVDEQLQVFIVLYYWKTSGIVAGGRATCQKKVFLSDNLHPKMQNLRRKTFILGKFRETSNFCTYNLFRCQFATVCRNSAGNLQCWSENYNFVLRLLFRNPKCCCGKLFNFQPTF